MAQCPQTIERPTVCFGIQGNTVDFEFAFVWQCCIRTVVFLYSVFNFFFFCSVNGFIEQVSLPNSRIIFW